MSKFYFRQTLFSVVVIAVATVVHYYNKQTPPATPSQVPPQKVAENFSTSTELKAPIPKETAPNLRLRFLASANPEVIRTSPGTPNFKEALSVYLQASQNQYILTHVGKLDNLQSRAFCRALYQQLLDKHADACSPLHQAFIRLRLGLAVNPSISLTRQEQAFIEQLNQDLPSL